jgi:hypothetical protein
MVNPNRRAYSTTTGKVAEVRFKSAAQALGLTVEKSTRTEDTREHVDFWMAYGGDQRWGVDVKGNNLPHEIWCEFKNVNGDTGWMYGSAHIIAFDMPEEGGFCIVNRQDLARYCEENVEDVFVRHPLDAYKKKYQRQGRSDVITKISILDLMTIDSYRVWYYHLDYR